MFRTVHHTQKGKMSLIHLVQMGHDGTDCTDGTDGTDGARWHNTNVVYIVHNGTLDT